MFGIKRGSNRLVFLTPWVVLKIPLLKRSLWVALRRRDRCNLELQLELLRRAFLQNIDEFLTWQHTKAPFLAPTYLSLGFLNIQKFIPGEVPTFALIEERLKQFFGTPMLGWISGHTLWEKKNYKLVDNKLIMVDYGSDFASACLLSHFLCTFHPHIAAAFGHGKQEPRD